MQVNKIVAKGIVYLHFFHDTIKLYRPKQMPQENEINRKHSSSLDSNHPKIFLSVAEVID